MPSKEDIDQQQKLLAAHRDTVAHYLRQQAQLGTDYAPAGIAEARAGIAQCKTILRTLGVEVEDHPDDRGASIPSQEPTMTAPPPSGIFERLTESLRQPARPLNRDVLSAPVSTLLPLKLTPPPPREGVLIRPDLQAWLPEVRLHPITLVIAPAGYGKTTLLSQWVQDLNRTGAPVCWLAIDGGDRDPAAFLAYLIRAFQTVFSDDLGADAWRVLHSAAHLEQDWPLVAGALCSDLQRKPPLAAFLVLDDVHLAIESAVIGQILGYILRAAPPTLHIIMAARRTPTFAPLARMRTEDRVLEISQRQLLLATEEVRQILAAQDVQLSDAALDLLLERTEGWVLSVQLAARALAALPPERRSEFVQTLGGGQEQLLGYLSMEVLAELPAEVLDFLRLAAIPAYFDAALLAEALPDRDGTPYLLQRAQRLGLPILPIDKHGDRLRFHPLWRELLLRGLAEALGDEQLALLHHRFGRALEQRGDLEAALDHYASAGATDDLARALREHAWPLLHSPRRETVRRWLEQLPPEARERDADLLYIWGMSQATAEPTQATAAIERAAELYRQAGAFQRELRALADLAAQLFWQMRPSRIMVICMRAVRAANRVRDTWSQGAARVCVTAILYSKGRYVAVLRVARQATAQPLNPAWRWLLGMIVATIHCQLGRPAEALTMIADVLQLPQVAYDDRLRQNLLRQRALALYELGQTSEALTLTLDAHRHLGDYYRDGIAAFSAAQLALLLVLQRRVDEATTYIAQARAAFHSMGVLGPLVDLQVIEVYGLLLRGQAAHACAAVGSVLRRLQEANAAEADLRLWLLLTLVLGEGGEHARALALATETVRQMRERGYWLFLASAQLYRAYLAGRCGDHVARDEALRDGWALVAADEQRYLPMLPPGALREVIGAALRQGVAPEAAGAVLRRQIPDQAVGLLQDLLSEPASAVRASAARLLGDLGAAAAYPALRALRKERDASVRQAAEQALSRLSYRPPYTLQIRTLGAFSIWRGDQEVRDRDWHSSKAQQLFWMLLTERGRLLPRDRLLDTLWPELEQEAATNNLRVTLTRLSKAIEPDRPDGAPPSYILQRGAAYSFNQGSDCQLDAAEFASAVAEGQRAERSGQRQAAIGAFRRAVALYGGPYLPHLYEDRTVAERERLALLFNDAALRLGRLLLDEGLAHEAIGLGWRILENDQAHEEAYQLLMRAHATLGERSTALRLYMRCSMMLRDELGVEPLPETTALYTSLREMR